METCGKVLLCSAQFIRQRASTSSYSYLRNRPNVQRVQNYSTNLEEPNVLKSPFPDIQEPDGVTVTELMRELAGSWGDAKAYECAHTGLTLTHNQVYAHGRSFAAALIASKNLKRGDTIAIVLPNIPQFAPILHGIWDAGMIASTINPDYTPHEMSRQIQSSNSKVAITTSTHLKVIQAIRPKVGSIIVVGEAGGGGGGGGAEEGVHSYNEMIKSSTLGVNFLKGSEINTKETVALLPYSSGTTGLPKGVMLTHANLATNLLQITTPPAPLRIFRFEKGQPQEKYVGLIPFFHAYGLCTFMVVTPAIGAHVMCLSKFNHELFLKMFRTHKPTKVQIVAPLVMHIAESPNYGKEELAAVHTVLAGAAPVGPNLINKLLEKAGRELFFQECYGMSETSPGIAIIPDTFGNTKSGSCGVPCANTYIKIMSLDGKERSLGTGDVGEICVKGPQVMKGYWKNPEATATTIKNGWLHTGDVGYYDADKCLFIVDRIKELIKVKGFQVAPAELEEVLRAHPSISEAAVVGIPYGEGDEIPRAYVVLEPNAPSLTEQEIKDYIKTEVAHYKQLKGGVEFVKSVPKSPTGKILRRELVKTYCDKMGIKLPRT